MEQFFKKWDFTQENSADLIRCLFNPVNEDFYLQWLFDLKLQVYGCKKFPDILPGVHHKNCHPNEIEGASPEKLELINVQPDQYAWWFSLFSDSTGLSLDYFYPWQIPDGCEGIVYGVSEDFSQYYKHRHTRGASNDELCHELLETSIKHWVLQIDPSA